MDDATALIVMQRFGQACFAWDARRPALSVTSEAQWHFAFGAAAPQGRVTARTQRGCPRAAPHSVAIVADIQAKSK